MITLEVHEARTFFSGPEAHLERMFEVLRLKDKNAWFKAKFLIRRFAFRFKEMGEEDKASEIERIQEDAKWIKFYDRRSDSFASGLLSRVCDHLDRIRVKYKVYEKRQEIRTSGDRFVKLHFRDKIEVREEQLGAIRVACSKGRGLLHCATNFGKTEVAAAIIAEFTVQTKQVPRVFFIIHRAGLALQTMRRFQQHLGDPKSMEGIRIGKKEYVIPVNMIGAGQKQIPHSGVLVATTQTASILLKRVAFRKFLAGCDILFVDEFHVNKALQASRIVDRCGAPMRFGLSGTIDKKNEAKMLHYVGMTGPIIVEVRNKELVEKGRSAKPYLQMVEVHSKKLHTENYMASYRLGVVKNKVRNRLVVKYSLQYVHKNWRTLVTVSRRAHGFRLLRKLEKRMDVPVEFIHGTTPLTIRDKIVKRFEAGKIAVLVASPIFDVGMDVPAIEAWVNAAGGLGWELILQRLGRVLRKKKGRNRVHITDFIDMHDRYLFKHSLARLRAYQAEDIVDQIKIVGKS